MSDTALTDTETAVAPPVETPPETPPVETPPIETPPTETPPETPPTEKPPEHWLPEELRDNERLKDFDSPESMAKAFADAALAPELPENYTLPEGAPEQLAEFAKANGYSQKQLDSMLGLKVGMDKAQADAAEQVNQQGLETLYTEWGDDKNKNLSMAQRALKHVDPDGKVSGMLKTTGAGNNPEVLRLFQRVGSILAEGGFIESGKPTGADNRPLAHRLYPNDVPKK